MADRQVAYVKAFRLGNLEVEVGGSEGKSLKDIAGDIGLAMEGNTWVLNGKVLSGSEAESATVRPDDRVQVAKDNDSGSAVVV